MKPIHALSALSIMFTLTVAACVPKPVPPAPVQTPVMPVPSAPPVQAPTNMNWMDVPATPGDWRYAAGVASFGGTSGAPQFTLRCDASTRSVILTRTGRPVGAPQMTIRTETQTRSLNAAPASGAGATAAIVASLPSSDRLLDAMALSKGRFAVEAPGTTPMYLPSWAEVTRVIEDCR